MTHVPNFGRLPHCIQRALIVLVLGLCMALVTPASIAQDTAASFDEINNDAALARLSDADLRRLVAERLSRDNVQDEAADVGFHPAVTVWRLSRKISGVRNRFEELLSVRHRLRGEMSEAWAKVSGPRETGSFIGFLVSMVVALGLGLVAERIALGRLKSVRLAVVNQEVNDVQITLGTKLAGLAGLLGIRLVGVLLLCVVAAIVFFAINSSGNQDRTTFYFYLGALVLVRVASAITAVFYAPHHPSLRLPLYSDEEARGLHRGIVLTVALTAFAFFTCALFGTLGVTTDAHPLLLLMVGNLFVITFVVTVFRYRNSIARDFLNVPQPKAFRSALAPIWPWVLMSVVIGIWVLVAFTALSDGWPLYGAAISTVAILLFYPTVDSALERAAVEFPQEASEISVALIKVGRLLSFVIALVVLAVLWNVDVFNASAGGLGSRVAAGALEIGATCLVAYVIWQVFSIWIDRKIAQEDAEMAEASGVDPGEMEIGGEGLSRIRTLLPLLKMTLKIALGLIVLMIILSALGVNIGPVLAGAGVLGLAIGFGSQTLVRDIVSGGFFLIDDAFRLGEYVDVGSVKGTVEKIQIRSLRLRHHRGAVHTVPFGEIATLTNYSRDWAIMKLKFVVPFDTDVERLRKVLKKVGQQLLEHPDVGEDFLQPFKSQGVLEIGEHGLVVRAKFMSKPGKQFLIRRHAYVALQDALRENDIEFARPQIRVVSIDEDEDIKAGAAAALGSQNRPTPA